MLSFLYKNKARGIFVILFLAIFTLLSVANNYSLLRLDLSSSRSTTLKIYWTSRSEPNWSESQSVERALLGRSRNHMLILKTPLSEITKIRVDPSNRRGVKTALRGLHFYGLENASVSFTGREGLSRFEPNSEVVDFKRGKFISFRAASHDPYLTAIFPPPKHQRSRLNQALLALVLSIVLLCVVKSFGWWSKNYRWIPLGMAIAGVGIALMAGYSKMHAHPDEHVHLRSGQYFEDNYIPPVACSEPTLHTYSHYGISRLDGREIAYYVGGRYLQALSFLPFEDYTKLRSLNVLLFFILVLLAYRQPSSRLLFLPILLTPQAWYLFSYYNSDAFSLFAVMLLAYQVFVPESMLRRLLKGERPKSYGLWVVALSIIVAMQYWLKLNYMFYSIFLFMLAGSWWLTYRSKPIVTNTRPLLVAIFIGTALFATWEVSRHAINDFSLAEKAYDCREEMANKLFKPSTQLAETHPYYNLKSKGVSVSAMLKDPKYDWGQRIFYSGLGAYGYLEYFNTYTHYEIVVALILLVGLLSFLTIAIKGNAMERMSLLSMLMAMLALTLAAFWSNWTQDYQPQGRYLMVYIPLFGSILMMNEKYINKPLTNGLSCLVFLLAVFSFYAVGLIEIPKA
ncbi:MAG: hypothetical protein ACI9PZ_001791 [Parvicella sp.]|jgi:hypothetical protein